RAKYSGLLRNVAIAMGNSGHEDYVPVLKEMAASPDGVVAEHARWAIEQICRGKAGTPRRSVLPDEPSGAPKSEASAS
ncbi:MAG: hypothetical protein JO065_12185, partial [Acidobacteria bacterium]|nr:hypothetical protein [Acidobacteriota bacterium]